MNLNPFKSISEGWKQFRRGVGGFFNSIGNLVWGAVGGVFRSVIGSIFQENPFDLFGLRKLQRIADRTAEALRDVDNRQLPNYRINVVAYGQRAPQYFGKNRIIPQVVNPPFVNTIPEFNSANTVVEDYKFSLEASYVIGMGDYTNTSVAVGRELQSAFGDLIVDIDKTLNLSRMVGSNDSQRFTPRKETADPIVWTAWKSIVIFPFPKPLGDTVNRFRLKYQPLIIFPQGLFDVNMDGDRFNTTTTLVFEMRFRTLGGAIIDADIDPSGNQVIRAEFNGTYAHTLNFEIRSPVNLSVALQQDPIYSIEVRAAQPLVDTSKRVVGRDGVQLEQGFISNLGDTQINAGFDYDVDFTSVYGIKRNLPYTCARVRLVEPGYQRLPELSQFSVECERVIQVWDETSSAYRDASSEAERRNCYRIAEHMLQEWGLEDISDLVELRRLAVAYPNDTYDGGISGEVRRFDALNEVLGVGHAVAVSHATRLEFVSLKENRESSLTLKEVDLPNPINIEMLSQTRRDSIEINYYDVEKWTQQILRIHRDDVISGETLTRNSTDPFGADAEKIEQPGLRGYERAVRYAQYRHQVQKFGRITYIFDVINLTTFLREGDVINLILSSGINKELRILELTESDIDAYNIVALENDARLYLT